MSDPSGTPHPGEEASPPLTGAGDDQASGDDQALSTGDAQVPGTGDDQPEAAPEREWWDDPGMPWKQKPTRSDIACMAWIGFLGLFSLALLPLRGWLLGRSLPLLLVLTGSRTAAAGLGSLVAVGEPVPQLVLLMLAGTVMSIKFHWIYWWAGKLWGRGMIEVWAGQSERSTRNYERAERWATRWGALGIFVAYVPLPLPIMPVVFILSGAHGMSIKRFMTLDFVACLVWLFGYFALGLAVGEPAVFLLRQYARFANWVAIALVVFVVASYVLNQSKRARAAR